MMDDFHMMPNLEVMLNLQVEAEHPGLDCWTASQMMDDLHMMPNLEVEAEEEKKKKIVNRPRWRKGVIVVRKKINRPRWRKGTLVIREDVQML